MTVLDNQAAEVTLVPVAKIGSGVELIGHTGEVLGTMTTLQGTVVRGNRLKGDEKGPILQVRSVNGRATTGRVEIPIRAYRTDFGKPYYLADFDEGARKRDPERSLPSLQYGDAYEFWGFETGQFMGEPDEAAWDGGIAKQRAGFRFVSEFVVVKGKVLAKGK
jgi:hypothetical protein